MYCIRSFLVILVFLTLTSSVQVNVKGTVSLGKDLMDSISQFLGNVNSRRSILAAIDEDPITEIVRTAVLCRDHSFCFRLRKFIEEFLTVLARSMQRVLNETLKGHFKRKIFEEQLVHYLEIVRNILENANSKATEGKEIYYWTDTIKQICAKFQEMALVLLPEELQADAKDINKIKDKLVIAIVIVEMKYNTKLCVEYFVCIKSYKVTKLLNTVLERFKTTTDDKVRLFMKYFYEALFNTAFYMHLSEKTANELQVVLHDMAYSNKVPIKDVLSSVHKIVEARLESIDTNRDENLKLDALLFHAILSDMDHIYSVHKGDPFADIFQNFNDWVIGDIKIEREMLQVVTDIEAELKNASGYILMKILNEVRVFLDITVNTGK